MIFITIDEAKKMISPDLAGARVAFVDPDGRVRIGTVRIKTTKNGKYAYAQYRAGEKVSEKYIGVVR